MTMGTSVMGAAYLSRAFLVRRWTAVRRTTQRRMSAATERVKAPDRAFRSCVRSSAMTDDFVERGTLDDFRVRLGAGRVILMLAVLSLDREDELLTEVAMTASEAGQIATDLVARAERVERERR